MLKVGDVRVWCFTGNHYEVIEIDGNHVVLLLVYRAKGFNDDVNRFTATRPISDVKELTRPLTPLEKAMK